MPETPGISRRRFLANSGSVLLADRVASSEEPSPETERTRRSPVIDNHVHAGRGEGLISPPTTIADPEEILRRMEEAGIDQAVIFPIFNRTYEKANEEIARICRQYPGKFVGYAKHDPITERGRIRPLLLREYHELGLRGLKLHTHPTREMLEVAAELEIPVIYHPRMVSHFEEVVARYPTLNFILAHMGRDEEVAAIEVAKGYPNAYLDTANVVTTRWIELAVQELPAEKILFGSDEPEIDCRKEIYKIRVLGLSEEKEDLILGGNLLRLLRSAV
jgi:predicted TIM-barrel fold metal-dependent hydrolase